MVQPDRTDEISTQLHAQDASLRRRMLWWTILPVLAGLAVLATAWVGVEQAREQEAKLAQRSVALAARIREQRSAIEDLETHRAALGREVAAQQDLLNQITPKLSAGERAQTVRIQQGLGQLQSGDVSAAIQTYGQAIAADARNPLPYRLRGVAYYTDGQYDAAVKSLRQALVQDPQDHEARYTLGLSLWALGQRDEAAREIERAFGSAEVQARALQDPAYRPIRTYQDDQAGQRSSRSGDEKAWIDQGLAAARRGDFTDAVAAYEQALKVQPTNWRVLNWQGYALLRDKKPAEAIPRFERARALAPTVAEVHYNLALALWQAGQPGPAQASLQRAYEVDPKYRTAVERDPQSKALRASMGR